MEVPAVRQKKISTVKDSIREKRVLFFEGAIHESPG
jgi:hypothetical protein